MKRKATDIRKCLVKMHCTGSHFGSAMSIADILTVLYFKILNIPDPEDPARDRFILSKGHAASCWYATLAARGFVDQTVLNGYLSDGGSLYGHPVRGSLPGIEASTGSLGHGLALGAGMALAAKNDGASWRVFVLMGDGETQEGSVWEAAMLSARLRLDNLVAVIDANNLQGFDRVENVQPIETFRPKWEAFGWAVREANGHDHRALEDALLDVPFEEGKPSILIAHTTKGKGVSDMEDRFESHYLSVPKDKVDTYIEELNKDCD